MASRHENGAHLSAVLTRLADAMPDLAERTCARIYGELDSYARIPPEALAAAVGRNLRTALAALRSWQIPEPAALDGAAQTARERYESGVPVEEIVRGFRISIALIHEDFLDYSVAHDLPAEVTVGGSRIVWGVGDAFTTRIITEYHALALEAALADARVRAAAVHRLLEGRLPADAAFLAIDPHGSYAVVRCEVAEIASAERVRARLEASGSTAEAPALVVADDGGCIGIVAARPADPGVAVGLGPFVAPDELPRSDRIARQALQLAQRLDRGGVQGLEELGWRMAAASRPDVWRLYAERFRAPLDAEGEYGADLRTAVLAWLRHQQNVNRAAAAINVHINTLRYRLRRYAEVTGCDLNNLDDVIGVTWALELDHPDHYSL